MKILIIEDENITAEELSFYLFKINPNIEILATLESVEESVQYISTNGCPDLIFSDIQLADGLSFEIYEQVNITCPIIFCTAYEEYAIQSFHTNSIDYILKPFDEKAIRKSMQKYEKLNSMFSLGNGENIDGKIKRLLSEVKYTSKRNSILVNSKGKYFPIMLNDVNFFYSKNEITWLYKKDGEKYSVNFTLDEIEKMIDNNDFYKANRQFVINRKALVEFEPYFNRKLSLKLTHETPELITVSKEKSSDFIRWVEMG